MIVTIMSEAETYDRCKSMLLSTQPHYISRIGGTDTHATLCNWNNHKHGEGTEYSIKYVREFNGFYSFNSDPYLDYFKYVDVLAECYQKSDEMFVGEQNLLTLYFPNRMAKEYLSKNEQTLQAYRYFFDDLFRGRDQVVFHPYDFVERIISNEHTLFRLFAEVLPGKKVLVVSPFGESLQSQWSKRRKFFKGFEYPEFDLLTYETPVTYSGLPREMYPDESWNVTAARMAEEISALDFDIALLACGSYAMPLGIHIRDNCKKDAIYVGGCLQLFFGVMGRRWANLPYFTDQINVENFILPSEGEKFKKHANVTEGTITEAFGAYF